VRVDRRGSHGSKAHRRAYQLSDKKRMNAVAGLLGRAAARKVTRIRGPRLFGRETSRA